MQVDRSSTSQSSTAQSSTAPSATAQSSTSKGSPEFGALQGVRVIDLTQMLAGPYCTQLLADQGADVVKIEPLGGEESRRAGPFHADDELKAFGGYFASVNRNKRSICLNIKTAEARQIILDLVQDADVLVENYRAGVMDRLGLSYETLRGRNPKLVYATIRGFGDPRGGESPYVDWPAYDVVAQAMGGLMQINGPDPHTPMKVGPGVGDLFPAALCAYGITAALFRAQRTGEGQFVDVAMVDSILALCERTIHQHSFQGVVPHPEGNRHPLLAPFGLFRASDGHVALAAHFDPAWQKLCALIGREDLKLDARTVSMDARVANRDFVYDEVERFTRARTKASLATVFGGSVPFGPVNDVRDVIRDPHFLKREMVVKVPHPGLSHQVAIAGIPVKLTGTPGRIASRAPLAGEHTAEVLESLGLSKERIDALLDQRVVG